MSDQPGQTPAATWDEPELRSLVTLAESTARAAGSLVEQGRRAAPVTVAATKSSPTDVVTAMDRAAEQLITDLVHQARPDDALFGEPARIRRGQQQLACRRELTAHVPPPTLGEETARDSCREARHPSESRQSPAGHRCVAPCAGSY